MLLIKDLTTSSGISWKTNLQATFVMNFELLVYDGSNIIGHGSTYIGKENKSLQATFIMNFELLVYGGGNIIGHGSTYIGKVVTEFV